MRLASRSRFGILEKLLSRALLCDTFNRVSPLLGLGRYAKGELKTVDDLKSEHKRVMKTLPPPTGVDTKKARVADTPPEPEKLRTAIPKKRLGAKTKPDDGGGSDLQPSTPHEECKPDAVDAYTERLRRTKAITFIEEEIEAHTRVGELDSVG